VLYRDVFLHAELSHEALDPVGTENPEKIVFKRKIESGRAGITLAA
jgi:hypothetical protein